MLGRQTDVPAGQRLFQPERQTILVTAGDERRARCRTDRRVGVRLQKAHAVRSDAVDVRRTEIGTSVARHVGITEIVCQNEDDVRRARHRLPNYTLHA